MKSSTRWILYSLFRVGLFAAALVAMLLLGLEWWMAAVVATLVAFAISYIFFSEPRRELARDLEARHQQTNADLDNDIENAALDSRDGSPEDDSATEVASAPRYDYLKNDHRGEA